MAERIITGFHAIEERVLKSKDAKNNTGLKIFYSKPGPRVKKILEAAKEAGIQTVQSDTKTLDGMAKNLPEASRDHRGIVLLCQGESSKNQNPVDFDAWILNSRAKPETERQTVIILDSVTDPHNVGAIIRSADQFGASLVIVPNHRGTKNVEDNEIVARSSAGAVSWVPVCQVTNLVRTAQILKENGFWIYGADAGGEKLSNLKFGKKTAIVMGSEGSGIAKLLSQQCDSIISIPTCGKIDSLNVSVASGVLLYEIYRQELSS